MCNNYNYDILAIKEITELKESQKHMGEAYRELQRERDALSDENQKLVDKILKLQEK